MVAFNFQKQFVSDILSGAKQSTIRQTKRCNVGDKMHLYTDPRTKYCQKIADAVCVGIAYIHISDEIPWKIKKTEGVCYLPKNGSIPFHEYEGFSNLTLFVDFFRKQYGLPFEGYVHYWSDLENKIRSTEEVLRVECQ